MSFDRGGLSPETRARVEELERRYQPLSVDCLRPSVDLETYRGRVVRPGGTEVVAHEGADTEEAVRGALDLLGERLERGPRAVWWEVRGEGWTEPERFEDRAAAWSRAQAVLGEASRVLVTSWDAEDGLAESDELTLGASDAP